MRRRLVRAIVIAFCLLVSGSVHAATPLGPGFTYQGQYEQEGSPVTGSIHLRFSLWDAEVDGIQIGADQLLADIPVVEGGFSVLLNPNAEFGADAFNGEGRWLEIETCVDAACNSSTTLSPRQPITGTPNALNAVSAPWSGLTDVPAGFADNVDNSGDSLWGNNGSDIFYNAGKVGVGSDTPHHQLRISGGPLWTSNQWAGSLELDNGAAIGWQSNGTRGFGIGHTFGGLHFFSTESDLGVTTTEAQYALTITDFGQVGVGTIAPDTKFQVNDGRIRIRETATSERWDLFYDPPSQKFYLQENAAFNHLVFTKGPDGLVGMGTDTPETKLHVSHPTGSAILGNAPNGNGVVGRNALSGNAATAGINTAQGGVGIFGLADLGSNSIGVWGASQSGLGALGSSNINVGVKGTSNSNIGVQGISTSSTGVEGRSTDAEGIYGYSGSADPADAGVVAVGGGGGAYGLRVIGNANVSSTLEAAFFFGANLRVNDARINNNLIVDGDIITKSTLKIDHPLDPGNKYLSHSSVESPDMMNIYNGNVVTDATGYAEIVLPDYFEALNKDFRYQLTVMDDADSADFVQAKVVKKIEGNQFTIRTSQSNVEVSWQVTGIRQDAYAKANPMEVEKVKPENDRGKYLAPEVFGQPEEMGIHYRPEMVSKKEMFPVGE